MLYNRKTNKGYLLSRLNRERANVYKNEEATKSTRKRKFRKSKHQEDLTQIQDINDVEDIIILKNANVATQKELIKNKLKATLAIRSDATKFKITNFSEQFPFYFTSPDLVNRTCRVIF